MGPHWTQRSPRGRSSSPRGPKTEVQEPSGASFLSLLGPILDVFQYHSRPPFDYAELCLHQYPTTKNERIRRNNFHDFVAVQLMVRRTISRPTITWTAIKSWKIHTLMAVGREIVRPTIGCDGGGSGNVAVWPMVGRTISRPTSMKVCIFQDFVAV